MMFYDNISRRFTDQDMSEINARLDRIEEAIVMLAGGGDDNQDLREVTTPQYNPMNDRNARSQRLFGSDDMIVKGNLSVVDPNAYDFGKNPVDKSTVTTDSAQTIRDRFHSRNGINDRVAAINSRNKSYYSKGAFA